MEDGLEGGRHASQGHLSEQRWGGDSPRGSPEHSVRKEEWLEMGQAQIGKRL